MKFVERKWEIICSMIRRTCMDCALEVKNLMKFVVKQAEGNACKPFSWRLKTGLVNCKFQGVHACQANQIWAKIYNVGGPTRQNLSDRRKNFFFLQKLAYQDRKICSLHSLIIPNSENKPASCMTEIYCHLCMKVLH